MGGIGWLCFALLAIACVVGFVALDRQRKHRSEALSRLHEEISDYLHGGSPPDFSVEDEELAFLRNDISDMAAEMELLRDNKRILAEQTAQLVADISHQLKTPLAAMRLFCEMDAEDGSEDAKRQLKLVDHMEQLVLQLLRLERLKANVYEMHFAENCLRDVCMEEMELLSALYPRKKITIEGDACKARFDPAWMGEAIGNVLKNACEHTAEDGMVHVQTQEREGFVWVRIEDDGGGVPEAKLPMLFSRFSRVSAGGNGCGLGLAISRSILECHHGGAAAENTKRGLRVSLYFPIMAQQLREHA